MKNRFLSKSVVELSLNKDVPCLLSDPFHRTTLPFPLDITILSFVIISVRYNYSEF